MMTSTDLSLDPARTAVVVVDVQNDYCHPSGVFAQAGLLVDALADLVDRINTLVCAARAAGSPVIWVRMEWADDASVGLLGERSPFLREAGLRQDTWGAELVEGLRVEQGDVQIPKTRFSSFYDTPLEERLRELGVTTLVTAGVRTDFCIESTVRDAFFRDFDVVIAEDAVAGYFDDLHHNSLRVMQTVFARVAPVERVVAALREG